MGKGVCRTCLQPSNESIFKQVGCGGNQIPLVEMLMQCTGLEVTKSDKISLNICNNCTENITKMYLYRKICWESQAYLLSELQNKVNAEKLTNEPKTLKSGANPANENGHTEVLNPLDILEVRLDHLEQNDDTVEALLTDSGESKMIYTKKNALGMFCDFIKKSPKRGSNGAWKCRKCGNVNIRSLRMLQHLNKAHDLKIKFSEVNGERKACGSVNEKIDDDLTGVLTLQQALSTYTFYPHLDQVDLSLPRTTQECRECGYTNIVPNQMIYHLRNSHNIKILDGGEFKCMKCDVKCRSYYFLLLHEKTHNESIEQPISVMSRRNYECTKCDQKFETQFNFDRHMKIHVRKPNAIIPKRKPWVKQCVCEHCGGIFATPHSLREHVRTHTGEKPYSCKICDYRSAHLSSMSSHMRFHADIRPYKCDTCDRSYVSFSGLANHRLVHSNEMPYQCTICSKKFKNESTYRMHLKSHDPDTYLACEYCGRKFAAKKTLNLHIKQHTGEKPHACELCDKRFIQRKSWRLHMKNHHQKIVH